MIEVLCAGEVVAGVETTSVLWGLRHSTFDGINLRAPEFDDCFDEHGMLKPGIFTLRIRSVPELTLWALNHDSYWHGEITRPLEYLLPIRD